MSHGPFSVFTQTITTGNTVTPMYDLGRSWPYIYLVVPAMSAAIGTATCNIYIQGSSDQTNFYQVINPPVNTSTTAIITFTIANAVSQCVVPVPNGLRYMKVQVGNATTTPVRFDLMCSGD